jgi:predicted transcriptional regulator
MPDLKEMTASIVAGYIANTKVEADQIPNLIASVSSILDGLGKVDATPGPVGSVTKSTPAQIRKSITAAGIMAFEHGKT